MKIAVAGGYGAGLTMRVIAAPDAGETVSGGVLSIEHGGKASNQAVGAARLGASVALFTAIGDDTHAVSARGLWRSEGVDTHAVIAVSSATMAGFIIVDESGENRIAIAPGALAELCPDDAEVFRPAIKEATILLVSLEIPLRVAVRLLEIAREESTPTILNPAPASAIPDSVWPSVDIVTPNLSEAAMLVGVSSATSDPEDVAQTLARLSGSTVVLTAGPAGAFVVDSADSYFVDAAVAPRVRDTTGAGDAFNAALAVSLAEGNTLHSSVRFAAGAGALAVTADGVIPALPTRQVLDAFLQKQETERAGTS